MSNPGLYHVISVYLDLESMRSVLWLGMVGMFPTGTSFLLSNSVQLFEAVRSDVLKYQFFFWVCLAE